MNSPCAFPSATLSSTSPFPSNKKTPPDKQRPGASPRRAFVLSSAQFFSTFGYPPRRSCVWGFCPTQSQICRGRARPALRLGTNQTLVILWTSDKDVQRISTFPPAQNYRRVRFLSPLQSAGTARLFAQPRIVVISSALVTLNGCVA